MCRGAFSLGGSERILICLSGGAGNQKNQQPGPRLSPGRRLVQDFLRAREFSRPEPGGPSAPPWCLRACRAPSAPRPPAPCRRSSGSGASSRCAPGRIADAPISFSRRAISASLSISPASGISTFILPTRAVADSGPASPSGSTSMDSVRARKSRKLRCATAQRAVVLAGVGEQHRHRFAGGDVHLALDLADAQDELHHPLHLALGLRIHQGRAERREGLRS